MVVLVLALEVVQLLLTPHLLFPHLPLALPAPLLLLLLFRTICYSGSVLVFVRVRVLPLLE
jgi:hypothetical protein